MMKLPVVFWTGNEHPPLEQDNHASQSCSSVLTREEMKSTMVVYYFHLVKYWTSHPKYLHNTESCLCHGRIFLSLITLVTRTTLIIRTFETPFLQIRPVVQTVFPFEQCEEAYRRLAQGHARGKIAIQVIQQAWLPPTPAFLFSSWSSLLTASSGFVRVPHGGAEETNW